MAGEGRCNSLACFDPFCLREVQWVCLHQCNATWQKRAFGFYQTHSKINLYCWLCCVHYPKQLKSVIDFRRVAETRVCGDCYRNGGEWIDWCQQLVIEENQNGHQASTTQSKPQLHLQLKDRDAYNFPPAPPRPAFARLDMVKRADFGQEPEHVQVSAEEEVELLSREYVYVEVCTNPERCGWIPTEVLIWPGELFYKISTRCKVKAYYDNAAAGHGDSEHLVVLPGEEVRVNFPTFIKVAVCADPQRRGWIQMPSLLNDPYDKPPPPTAAPLPRKLPGN